MPRSRLTALAVERAQKSGKSVLLSDGDGLYLRRQTRDCASWTLRHRFAGKEHWLTLGNFPDMSLALARIEAAGSRATRQTAESPFTRRIFAFGARRRIVPSNPAADFSPRLDAGGTERPRSRALGARWVQFDLDGKTTAGAVWSLPGSRTKTGESLDIPLAPTVAEWLLALRALATGSEFVFPKRRRDPRERVPHMGIDTLNIALQRVAHGLPHFTLHDLRLGESAAGPRARRAKGGAAADQAIG